MNFPQAAEGIYIINKPSGITSFGVVHRIRKQLRVKRVGHAGTLDPFATGVLVVGVGRTFTRQLAEWQAKPKTYVATMTLGRTSETLDVDGKEWQSDPKFPENRIAIENQLQNPDFWKAWEGEQVQTPPQYSAKKIQGTAAYKLARKNQTVLLSPVMITIFKMRLMDIHSTAETLAVTSETTCSKGTYIRQLAADIAARVGTLAYLSALTRTSIGEATVAEAQAIEAIGAAQ